MKTCTSGDLAEWQDEASIMQSSALYSALVNQIEPVGW
jgi:hypothetical protein